MKKLVFLLRSLNIGGAERQLINLAKSLPLNDFDVTVVEFYSGGELEQEIIESEVKLVSLNKLGRWDVVGFFYRLFQCLKQIKPDILHGYLGVPNICTACLKPLFISTRIVWGVRASNVDFNHYNWLSDLVFKLECLLSRYADLIIVNSNAGHKYHRKHGFPKEKMTVIPNGIDTEKFKPDRIARQRIRAEWGLTNEITLIGLVGRLDPMKDHPNFLKAAALLLQSRSDVKFVCVGSGEDNYTKELYHLASTLNIEQQVIWAGKREDMVAVYNAIDILASSSSCGEGFPNVIGEAMACGVPCIVTDVGDSAWIVGDTGIVVPAKNPESLKIAMEKLIGSDRNNIYKQEEIRQRIIENFSLLNLVTKTKSVLLNL
ncbi:glycosyltransferase [Oscillatoria sp. FACHB-1406]|uniref:glycosyltransferase n=1 Tax=Oscillatoria sp. FACHB-1406 TaxID=2692846 RepID=UPI00168408D6|nr:glycosyltransferase [Oscillatoria sp. FACHB-1406]MBD2577198.1 glycosyltransferase [Oscillatoria sp. FACHB-1406]